jgi:hypothetical protein
MRVAVLAAIVAISAGAAPAARPVAAMSAVDATLSFEALRLSAEIAREGMKASDPWLLLAAARVRSRAQVQLGAGVVARGEDWIARAEAMGGDDPRVASVAADLRAELRKGRTAGPRVVQALIGGGRLHSFTETFHAGRPAVVYIEGDGDTNLTLKVGSACRDQRPGDVKICAWTPTRSEVVRVEIANVGRVDNRVILGTN